jgi:hypothetical protein
MAAVRKVVQMFGKREGNYQIGVAAQQGLPEVLMKILPV